MTVGEERDEDRFKNWQLCCVWKLPFRHHRTIQLTQNCVCFINPCIKLFVLSSALVYTTTRPKVLKRLHCCSVFPLICSVSRLGFVKRHFATVFFILISIPVWSHAAAHRSNVRLKTLFRGCKRYQIVYKKQAIDPAAPNSLLQFFCDDSNLHISVFKYLLHRWNKQEIYRNF